MTVAMDINLLAPKPVDLNFPNQLYGNYMGGIERIDTPIKFETSTRSVAEHFEWKSF